jgi:acyl carrier protein
MDIAAKVKEIVSDKLEEQFEIEIPDEDTEKIKTVRDAIEYIKAQKG